MRNGGVDRAIPPRLIKVVSASRRNQVAAATAPLSSGLARELGAPGGRALPSVICTRYSLRV